MDNKEIWKDVKGFEGLYSISSHGRLMSHHSKSTGSKILNPAVSDTGYHIIILSEKPKRKTARIHPRSYPLCKPSIIKTAIN